jgi:hypothetical protein
VPPSRGNADDAAPAIDALIHGRLSDLPDVQPLMGLTSIVGRAPFAAAGDAWGDTVDVYRFGAFACLWALAALALALGRSLRRVSTIGAVVVVGLVMFNPATRDALRAGHPEELLLAATAVGAVWLTLRAATTASGVLAGLAIGTKPFGVFTLLPQAIVAGRRRVATLATAIAVGAVLALPLPLLSPHTYVDGSKALAKHTRVYATSIWWPLGHARELRVSPGVGPETVTVRLMPLGFDRGTGTIVAAVFALAISLAAGIRRGEDLGADALGLLGAIFFARSFFDPQNLEYYAAPGFAALIAWEVLARRRPPILSLVAVAFDALTFHDGLGHAGLQSAVFLLWIVPLTAYLAAVSVRRA